MAAVMLLLFFYKPLHAMQLKHYIIILLEIKKLPSKRKHGYGYWMLNYNTTIEDLLTIYSCNNRFLLYALLLRNTHTHHSYDPNCDSNCYIYPGCFAQ